MRWHGLVSVGYSEPSLVFLAGTDTVLVRPDEAVPVLKADPTCTLAAVEARDWPAFQEALQGTPVETLTTIEGLNYSKGKQVSMRLVRVER